jgi:hypothetical protein
MTEYRNAKGGGKPGYSGSEGIPLVVDLDRTLLRTVLLLESGLRLLKQRPWLVLLMPFWLLKGRAYLKRKIFQRVQIDVPLLLSHTRVPAPLFGCPTEFVVEQPRKMPVFLSRPILLATAVFGVSRLLLEGSLFHNRPPDQLPITRQCTVDPSTLTSPRHA